MDIVALNAQIESVRAATLSQQHRCLELEEQYNTCVEVERLQGLEEKLNAEETKFNRLVLDLRRLEGLLAGIQVSLSPESTVPALALPAAAAASTLTPPIKDSVAKTGDLGATPVPSWSVFVSYCWRNSKDAFVRGQIDSDFGCGSCDPRVLATRLSAAGFPCWIDMEQLEVGEPLFEDLVDTIKRSKFAVICVSTEYADSENCKDEFKFIRKIKIPKIIVVVGPTHSVRDWSTTVIGFMASDAVYIDARGPSSFGLSEPTFQRILTAVQHGLLKPNNSEQVHAEFSLTDMRTMFLSGASTRDSDRFR